MLCTDSHVDLRLGAPVPAVVIDTLFERLRARGVHVELRCSDAPTSWPTPHASHASRTTRDVLDVHVLGPGQDATGTSPYRRVAAPGNSLVVALQVRDGESPFDQAVADRLLAHVVDRLESRAAAL